MHSGFDEAAPLLLRIRNVCRSESGLLLCHNKQKMWLPGAKVAGEHRQHPDDCWQVGLQSARTTPAGRERVVTSVFCSAVTTPPFCLPFNVNKETSVQAEALGCTPRAQDDLRPAALHDNDTELASDSLTRHHYCVP
ncbi:jg7920 [Pararge aegeria aegeria]|uniref:Jg7920 protein n=1 Tax=Pararge aegeria aegeria TaxID=348720 RepID=A0A8S4R2Z0_9NEOP|nr:jg7920 [Pararge aegeria aegeria]